MDRTDEVKRAERVNRMAVVFSQFSGIRFPLARRSTRGSLELDSSRGLYSFFSYFSLAFSRILRPHENRGSRLVQ